jgi:4-amino-4-deoxy-L-arabinose transferase-like glycosyltransferase
VIAWVLVGLTLCAGYGWAARLLRGGGLLAALLGLALSVGALTLIMLWEGLLGIPFSFAGIALPCFALMLPGFWHLRLTLPRLPRSWSERFMLLVILAISAAALFNGAYWPFHRDDTLGIYQPAAQAMYLTQALVPLTGADSLYRAYPILVPLSYSYAYFAAGWENEYLAKAIATILSLACLPAAYALGKQWRGALAGWNAALLLALTPFFSRWASSGYVDLPMAFLYTLAALFALRLWETGTARDAVLAGVLVGLAAWTKNAALMIGVPLVAAWLAWCVLRKRAGWRAAALGLAACAAVAAPWYVRNALGAGFLIPATAWTDQAQRTLENAFVFVTHPENFGAPGWALLFGLGAALLQARRDAGARLLLLLSLPFFAAWWLMVSYDPRFLLLFLPILCVLAGDLLARLWTRLGAAWQPRYRIALALLTLLLAALVLRSSVEYKGAVLRAPLMGDPDKRAIVGR